MHKNVLILGGKIFANDFQFLDIFFFSRLLKIYLTKVFKLYPVFVCSILNNLLISLKTYLSSCYEYCWHNIGSVGIEPSNTACHGWANQILVYIEIYEGGHRSFENVLHHLTGNDGITHDRLASTLNPAKTTLLQ